MSGPATSGRLRASRTGSVTAWKANQRLAELSTVPFGTLRYARRQTASRNGGGLHKKTPALMARAHDTVTTWGFTVAAIDAPGHGDRPRTAEDEQARADLRQARAAGDTERFQSISVRYVTSLAEGAVPVPGLRLSRGPRPCSSP